MSFQPKVPDHAGIVLAKPGCRWVEEERRAVKIWLATDGMITRYMIATAGLILGDGPISQDAEEAWQSFLVTRLDGVIDNLDPHRGDFWAYLKTAFKRHCRRHRERIARGLALVGGQADDEITLVLDPIDSGSGINPAHLLELEELRNALGNCLNELEPIDRRIILAKYVEEKNDVEIGLVLGIEPNYVKQRRFRALRRLREDFPDLWGQHGDGD
jgi:RNA polymerase sigma factor (sigma-70 family)